MTFPSPETLNHPGAGIKRAEGTEVSLTKALLNTATGYNFRETPAKGAWQLMG